jgi:CRP/FNR family transcriptional regulator
MRNKSSVIRKCPPFVGASAASIRRLSDHAEVRKVARRAPLWSNAERASYIAVVRSGVLRESLQLGEQAMTLRFCGRGDVVNLEAGFAIGPDAQVDAYEDSVVLQIPTAIFQGVVEQDASIARASAKLEAERRQQVQTRLAMVAYRTAVQRLASCLLHLGARFGVRDSRGTIVNLRVTHKELAAYIGATRETVSFAVTDLRRDGLIQTEGKRVILLDSAALKRLVR